MSNESTQVHLDCDACTGAGSLEQILQPREKDLGDFSVRRALPTVHRKHIGPWVFFDHMGPASFPAHQGVDVRPHPHIGLATVTYLFEGRMLHRDSLGTTQVIKPGDVNLMVAGRGIVHSEREEPAVREQPHRTHGLQLWLALPTAHEEMAPEFHHYSAGQLPALDVHGVPVKLIMGEAYGARSPVKTFSETLYLEAQLQAGQQLTLPNAEELGLYVVSGDIGVGNARLTAHNMGVFTNPTEATISALSTARIALIGGQHLGRRFIDWNFVSSRQERIEQAKQQWRKGEFPRVPGDDKEFIPLP